MIGIVFFLTVIAVIYFLAFGSHRAQFKVAPASKTKESQPIVIEYPKLFIPLVLAVVLAQQAFMYDAFFGLGIVLFNAVLMTALLLSFPRERRTFLVYGVVVSSILAGFAAVYRANGFVQSVDVVYMLGSLVLLVFLRSHQAIQWHGVWLLSKMLAMIPSGIGHFFNLFKSSTTIDKSRAITPAALFKTLALTLVVVFFFIGLLTQADPIFAKLVEELAEQMVGRSIAGLVFAILMTMAITYKVKADINQKFPLTFFSFLDLALPVGALVILFGVFLSIQYRYLFASHDTIAAFDLTYSEYVRKGFIELLWATLVASVIAYLVYLKSQVLELASHATLLKSLHVVLVFELAFLLLSAYQRNVLYIEAFGLTRVRVVGTVFLAWLAGVIILLLVMSLWEKFKQSHFLLGVWILSMGVVLTLNGVNVDRIIFTSTPHLENTKDYYYLTNLSEDVVDEWGGTINEIEQEVVALTRSPQLSPEEKEKLANAKLALISLQEKWEFVHKKYGPAQEVYDLYYRNDLGVTEDVRFPDSVRRMRNWQSSNAAERHSYDVFSSNKELYVDKVNLLLLQLRNYQQAYGVDLYDNEWQLLHDYRRPFISTQIMYSPERIGQ